MPPRRNFWRNSAAQLSLQDPKKLIRARIEQRENRSFIRFAILLANKISDLASVFSIKNGNGQRSAPPRQHRQAKRFFGFRGFPPVIGKYGFVARDEPPHQD